MKKSLLALAVLGAFAGVAQAQSAVVIYGNIDAGLVKQTDETLKIGKRASNTLGFKGTEELGNGLKALFQLEIRYEPDTGTNEMGGAFQRPLFQGQSRVGLQGDFGMVRIGRGLTAFQESTIAFEPFHGIPSVAGFYTDLQVGGNSYSSDPLGQAGNSGNRFSNAVWYNSPEVAGFQVNASVATKEATTGGLAVIGRGTALAPEYASGAQASANPYSVTATYKNGPAALMVGAERNAIETKLYSIAGSVMVTPELKLMASASHQNREHTMLNQWTSRSWVAGANYTLGAGKILAGYGQKTQGVLNNGEQKTKQFSLGYEYSLSKRTYVYTDASRKDIAGLKKNIFALGVNHSF